jgi:sulfate transporter 4
MAAGMHCIAAAGVGAPDFKKDEVKIDNADVGSYDDNVSICGDVAALSDEKSQEAARLLQARRKQRHPVRAYVRNFQCSDDGEEKPKRKQEPNTLAIFRFLPILTWAREITARTLKADLVAGLTVGVMVIPQSMSYASIAGLPYRYGLYSACVPTFVYAFLGQSRQLAVGPVAMVSLLVEAGLRGQLSEEQCPGWTESSKQTQYEMCPDEYVKLAFLTSVVVGIMQILSAVLKLGFLVSFLGHPVTSGFTSAAAIIIGLSQAKYMLGYDIPKSQYVHDTFINIFSGIHKTKPMALLLGATWLICLILNKKVSQKYKRLFFLGPIGPLVSCVVGTLLLWLIPDLYEEYGVSYVGTVPDGLFPFSLLDLRIADLGKVMPTALTACLIGYMESIAIGKNLAAKHGYEIEAGQELLALGVSNLVGGIFSCYPVTGSFSRSAVNNSTGALTQLSGLITSLIMLLTLIALTPLFYYLPKFALAAIVMNSVIPLVALSEARKLWHVKKQDCALWFVAFFGTLFLGVLMGICIAVIVSLVIVLYESVRPQLTILWRIPGSTIFRNVKQESSGVFVPNVFICRIGSSMYFANASFVKDTLLEMVSDLEEVNPTEYIVLEMTPVVSIDSTAVHVIEDIVSDFRSRGIQTAFAMVGNRVEKTLRRAKAQDHIGEQWFFPTVNDAVHYCYRHQRAKRKKGLSSGDVEITTLSKSEALKMTQSSHGNEIGFSNDLHHDCTMVFVSLQTDVPMIMSDITAVYKRNKITIIRAQIEPADDDGAKHTYYVKSVKGKGDTPSKLQEAEIERLREEMDAVISRHLPKEKGGSNLNGTIGTRDPSNAVHREDSPSHDRMRKLEDSQHTIQQQLDRQMEYLAAILKMKDLGGDLDLEASLPGNKVRFGVKEDLLRQTSPTDSMCSL